MARYTGPTTRVSRRFGTYVLGSAKVLERRNFPPGQHGPKSRRKLTDYALGLIEKQKLRYFYGLQERQFRGVYERALRRRGSCSRWPRPSRQRSGMPHLARGRRRRSRPRRTRTPLLPGGTRVPASPAGGRYRADANR